MKKDMVKGCIHTTKNCGDLEIVQYKNSTEKVVVRFIGYSNLIESTADRIRKGAVKNNMIPSVFGKGYIGVGNYSATKHKKAYAVWSGMLQRCYSAAYHKRQPTYKDCHVCSEWLDFQMFSKWFYEDSDFEDGLQLDKDIKFVNNKKYSPETCLFIPQQLNLLLRTHNRVKDDGCPVGVSYHKRDKCYRAGIYYDGVQNSLGCFSLLEDAKNAYKDARELLIKDLINKNTYPKITKYLIQHT